ncbi:9696_t:CDS:2 [Cetraspora pellucida]|uniref:9696_t:CDS:1 n=1 Tax=Cetraspora pellucida TaxID=1433469 RepID=A0A9N9JL63_9GLOM|nr:9696_t:CDS:2 [Cetraspora pellucida]
MAEKDIIQYLCSDTGDIYERQDYGNTYLSYYNSLSLNNDAIATKDFNRKIDQKQKYINSDLNDTEKILQLVNNEEITTIYVVAGGSDRKRIEQLEFKDHDTFRSMLNMLLIIIKKEEFKGKCINIICKSKEFRFIIKYKIHRWIEADLKKDNDKILEKISNNTDFDDLEDIEYSEIVNRIDDIMGKNDIMIDAELSIGHINNVNAFFRSFKPIIKKSKNKVIRQRQNKC